MVSITTDTRAVISSGHAAFDSSSGRVCLAYLVLSAGLCLEGARWDKEDGVLKDSLPNQLHPALPVLQVCPASIRVVS